MNYPLNFSDRKSKFMNQPWREDERGWTTILKIGLDNWRQEKYKKWANCLKDGDHKELWKLYKILIKFVASLPKVRVSY